MHSQEQDNDEESNAEFSALLTQLRDTATTAKPSKEQRAAMLAAVGQLEQRLRLAGKEVAAYRAAAHAARKAAADAGQAAAQQAAAPSGPPTAPANPAGNPADVGIAILQQLTTMHQQAMTTQQHLVAAVAAVAQRDANTSRCRPPSPRPSCTTRRPPVRPCGRQRRCTRPSRATAKRG
jgi:hypothetical protein